MDLLRLPLLNSGELEHSAFFFPVSVSERMLICCPHSSQVISFLAGLHYCDRAADCTGVDWYARGHPTSRHRPKGSCGAILIVCPATVIHQWVSWAFPAKCAAAFPCTIVRRGVFW